jgi:hypothetical protein
LLRRLQTDEGRDRDLPENDREGDGTPVAGHCTAPDAVGWYGREIDRALADADVRDAHPKVRATAEKAPINPYF